MSVIDPFTRGSQSYWNATRHPFKSGEAFEVTTPRLSWRDVVTLAVLIGFGWLVLTVAALVAAQVPGA